MKNCKLALILTIAVILLAGCSNADKTDVTNPVNTGDTTADAIDNTEKTTEPAFYSTDAIKIEDMDFKGVKFGDTRQEVVSKLGEPEGIGELYNEYYYANFDISFTEQDKVCLINIYENFSCYKDIKIGDDILATLKKLPIPTTPAGIETVYKEFDGNYAHDFTLLEDYFMSNTKHPQMPDQVNYTWRNLEFGFDNYILSIRYVSPKRAENDGELETGAISGIQVKTADAPLFED